MSIVLSYDICQPSGCTTLTFKDTTGAYSVSNTTGYGSPNEDISGATAELIVTLADGTSNTLDITSNGFPTVDTTKELTINSSDIGYDVDEEIEDQIISFTYRVTTTTPTVFVQNITQAFYCQVDCCVKSMFIDLDITCNDCIKAAGESRQEAWILLQGLKYSANSANVTVFNAALAELQKICSTTNCSNCK